MCRRVQLCATLHAVKLRQGIDFHHLDAGCGVVRSRIDDLCDLFGNAGRTCIAIAYWIAQQLSIAVDQTKVHAPSIYTDALDIVTLGSCFLKPRFHILKQRRKIPIHMVAQTHLSVAEAVYFFHHDTALVQPTCYHTTATAAKVGSQIYIFAHYL